MGRNASNKSIEPKYATNQSKLIGFDTIVNLISLCKSEHGCAMSSYPSM
jgi:hypothetical protein